MDNLPRLTFLGHSTVLIELAGLRILTDPVLFDRVTLLKRVVTSLDASLYAGIDLVLISHLHLDHFDLQYHNNRTADNLRRIDNLLSPRVGIVLKPMAAISLKDWWRIASRELPAGLTLGAILGLVGITRIVLWQRLGLYDYGNYWPLIAVTVGLALTAIVTFGSMTGSMLPFILKRFGFDPAAASAPFVATLVDVTGLVIYFSVAFLVLRGTLL